MSKIKLLVEIDEEDYGDFCDWFESVPSSVDGLPCVKGKFNTALYDAKPYNPTGDLISREYVRNLFLDRIIPYPKKLEDKNYNLGMCTGVNIIDNAPTVEITEEQAIDKLHNKEMTTRPQGEWILQYRCLDGEYYTCSHCERVILVEPEQSLNDYPFCHCGADMREGRCGK